jgi:hypothetical protein
VACRGMLFALTTDQEAELLRRVGDDGEVLQYVQAIEQAWDEPWLCQTDKAWDAMHRALGDSRLTYTFDQPLQGVIMGGKLMYDGDDYIMSFKTAGQVRDVAKAAAAVTDDDMATRYDAMDQDAYEYPKDAQDRGYTVGWFEAVRAFYAKAAAAGRSVIFTVDQ